MGINIRRGLQYVCKNKNKALCTHEFYHSCSLHASFPSIRAGCCWRCVVRYGAAKARDTLHRKLLSQWWKKMHSQCMNEAACSLSHRIYPLQTVLHTHRRIQSVLNSLRLNSYFTCSYLTPIEDSYF